MMNHDWKATRQLKRFILTAKNTQSSTEWHGRAIAAMTHEGNRRQQESQSQPKRTKQEGPVNKTDRQ